MRTAPFCSRGFGVGFGCINTEPHRVFGALGIENHPREGSYLLIRNPINIINLIINLYIICTHLQGVSKNPVISGMKYPFSGSVSQDP